MCGHYCSYDIIIVTSLALNRTVNQYVGLTIKKLDLLMYVMLFYLYARPSLQAHVIRCRTLHCTHCHAVA